MHPENFVCILILEIKSFAVSRMGFIFINKLCTSAILSKEVIFILRQRQCINGNGHRVYIWMKSMVDNIFILKKYTWKAVNDNNSFTPSLFRSLCETVSDCFGASFLFISLWELRSFTKISWPTTITSNLHNNLKKDGEQLLLSNEIPLVTLIATLLTIWLQVYLKEW